MSLSYSSITHLKSSTKITLSTEENRIKFHSAVFELIANRHGGPYCVVCKDTHTFTVVNTGRFVYLTGYCDGSKK